MDKLKNGQLGFGKMNESKRENVEELVKMKKEMFE
jgi:hypothetical protein